MLRQNAMEVVTMREKFARQRADATVVAVGQVTALVAVLLMAGCAGLEKTPATTLQPAQTTPPAAVAPVAVAVAVPPLASANTTQPLPNIVVPSPAAVTTIAPEPKAALSADAKTPAQAMAKATAAIPPAAAKATVLPAPLVKKDIAPAAPVRPAAAPSLDMKSLEARLKDTQAIGVFTKLALKNQVNDLLEQFRAFYRGQLKITLTELRRPYEMLLQKVLALLQDGDPPLAGAIVASREAIWGILADPAKFATI